MNVELSTPSVQSLSRSSRRGRADWPRLFFIAEGFASGRAGMSAGKVRERTAALVEAGLQAVQLRDHAASAEAFADGAALLAERLRAIRPDVLLSVNSRPEVAAALGAALHVGRRGPSLEEARRLVGPNGLVGYSAHAPSSVRRAALAGAHYVFVSPLFFTPSHPGTPPRGLRLLRRSDAALAGLQDRPFLYALGGVGPDDVAACLQAGADGVASLSRLLMASNPGAAVRTYLNALAA